MLPWVGSQVRLQGELKVLIFADDAGLRLGSNNSFGPPLHTAFGGTAGFAAKPRRQQVPRLFDLIGFKFVNKLFDASMLCVRESGVQTLVGPLPAAEGGFHAGLVSDTKIFDLLWQHFSGVGCGTPRFDRSAALGKTPRNADLAVVRSGLA